MLDNVETFVLDDAEVREWALDRLDQLVWKPADGSGGKGIVIGPRADEQTLVERCGPRSRPTRGRGSRSDPVRAVDRADVRRVGTCARATSTCARSR